jgi:hypothetical protein
LVLDQGLKLSSKLWLTKEESSFLDIFNPTTTLNYKSDNANAQELQRASSEAAEFEYYPKRFYCSGFTKFAFTAGRRCQYNLMKQRPSIRLEKRTATANAL